VLQLIHHALNAEGIEAFAGFGKPADAARAVTGFKEAAAQRPQATLALLLPLRGASRSAAAGVNLQEASVAYLFEPSTSAALEAQAVGRIARIGQTQAPTVVRLCLEATLEVDVLTLRRRLGRGRDGAAADELVTGEDLALLCGISSAGAAAAGVARPSG